MKKKLVQKKPLLTLPIRCKTASWNHTCHKRLIESGIFNVTYKRIPRIPRFILRAINLSIFYIDNTKVCLDTWDSFVNIQKGTRFFNNIKSILYGVDVVVRPQNLNKIDPKQMQYYKDIKAVTTNCSMFPSSHFPLGFFRYNPYKKFKYTAFITGKRRKAWEKRFIREKDFFVPNGQDYYEVDTRRNRLWNHDDFYEVMRQTQWGLVLKGKRYSGFDCKNRRTVEFSSCGMPLALNYQPQYKFDFQAYKHYYLIKSYNDLYKLRDVDPIPYHKMAVEFYEKYFSPRAFALILLQNIDKVLGTNFMRKYLLW